MSAKGAVSTVFAALAAFVTSPAFAADARPCELLKTAEVQAVAGPGVDAGTASVDAPTGTHSCAYKWTVKNFSPRLEVLVSDASKIYPGTSAETLKTGILTGPRASKSITVVPGVGEAAQYRAESETNGTAIAYLKGRILTIVYRAPDAVAKKDQVIGLLKSAASRL